MAKVKSKAKKRGGGSKTCRSVLGYKKKSGKKVTKYARKRAK